MSFVTKHLSPHSRRVVWCHDQQLNNVQLVSHLPIHVATLNIIVTKIVHLPVVSFSYHQSTFLCFQYCLATLEVVLFTMKNRIHTAGQAI